MFIDVFLLTYLSDIKGIKKYNKDMRNVSGLNLGTFQNSS